MFTFEIRVCYMYWECFHKTGVQLTSHLSLVSKENSPFSSVTMVTLSLKGLSSPSVNALSL